MSGSIKSTRQEYDKESLKLGFAEHLRLTLGDDRFSATNHDKYMALAYTIKDKIINRWIKTQQTHYEKNVKRVYYLSLEFLMGRAMGNNIINMGLKENSETMLKELGYTLEELKGEEVDAGLGNGGLGRLAACFLDSLASLNIPAFGYGIRYHYGIFKQLINNGYQVEFPDEWLRNGCPWEIERANLSVDVNFGGRVEYLENGNNRLEARWLYQDTIVGVPFDTPIVGYKGETINTLRLWSAKPNESFKFSNFNEGGYFESVQAKFEAENISQVLYPNDKLYLGKELRLKQQYFFVACSLKDIIRRFKKSNKLWKDFPKMCAIQLNDTHPAITIAELMRILIDKENLNWDFAWDIVVKSCGYTNHTLMPEALEKWPVSMFKKLLPRHLDIIFKINHIFLHKVNTLYPNDVERLQRMSIIEEGQEQQIRMAYLSIVGSHSINGVAALHTKLLIERLVPDFAEVFPDRFNNKTNGITQRRWLLDSNPGLSNLLIQTIGPDWITDLKQIKKIEPYIKKKDFLEKFIKIKKDSKIKFAEYLNKRFGWVINPDSIFDIQVKRIHEYKRQLLNALNIVMLYNKIKKGEGDDIVPRTFFIGGKAAPGYKQAKLIIKFINNLSAVINSDPDVNQKLQVYFLPNYRVSLAEKIFPAADVSQQISTAGTEASGTGNMKFMANGAITIGTLDGANIEIAEEVGDENIFIFGLTAEEVKELQPHYNPQEYINNDKEIEEALSLIFSEHFNFGEPHIFDDIKNSLLSNSDQYIHLADLRSYYDAQMKINDLYKDKNEWHKKALLNIARCGKFSSDRTILEYAKDIWKVDSCRIKQDIKPIDAIEDAKNYNKN